MKKLIIGVAALILLLGLTMEAGAQGKVGEFQELLEFVVDGDAAAVKKHMEEGKAFDFVVEDVLENYCAEEKVCSDNFKTKLGVYLKSPKHTAVSIAAAMKHGSIAVYLLGLGLSLETSLDESCESVLSISLGEGNIEVANQMINEGLDLKIEKCAVQSAMESGRTDIASRLVELGAPNTSQPISATTFENDDIEAFKVAFNPKNFNRDLLGLVVFSGAKKILKYLISTVEDIRGMKENLSKENQYCTSGGSKCRRGVYISEDYLNILSDKGNNKQFKFMYEILTESEHPMGGVVVLRMKKNGDVTLKRVYRYPFDKVLFYQILKLKKKAKALHKQNKVADARWLEHIIMLKKRLIQWLESQPDLPKNRIRMEG